MPLVRGGVAVAVAEQLLGAKAQDGRHLLLRGKEGAWTDWGYEASALLPGLHSAPGWGQERQRRTEGRACSGACQGGGGVARAYQVRSTAWLAALAD